MVRFGGGGDFVEGVVRDVVTDTTLPMGLEFGLFVMRINGTDVAEIFNFENGDIFDLSRYNGAKLLSLDLSDPINPSTVSANVRAEIRSINVTVIPNNVTSPSILGLFSLLLMFGFLARKNVYSCGSTSRQREYCSIRTSV